MKELTFVQRAKHVESDDDQIMVERILTGDPVAFTAFHDRYRDRVFRFIARQVDCEHEASDLTQETFLRAHLSIASFEARSSLSTWLLGIARNVVRHARRRASRWMIGLNRACSLDDRLLRCDAQIERTIDARRMLERCEAALSGSSRQAQREIFRRRYGENRSFRAIADELDKSRDAVVASMRRTRLGLRQAVPEVEKFLDTARS